MSEDDMSRIAYAYSGLRGFWRRLKAAGFWFMLGSIATYLAVLYAGPTHIEWTAARGFVAEIQYKDEMRDQMETLTRDCRDNEGNVMICPPPRGEE